MSQTGRLRAQQRKSSQSPCWDCLDVNANPPWPGGTTGCRLGKNTGWLRAARWQHRGRIWPICTCRAPSPPLPREVRYGSFSINIRVLAYDNYGALHTAMPEKNVCRYLNKVDSRWRACVTITRYTCILDVTLDPPKRVDYYPNYEIHFY